jgi:xanthine dehydrogenase molybdenum-binding subunit
MIKVGRETCYMGRQVHFMEVEVDTETGWVEVTKVVNVNDPGKAISPEGCNAQQYGGTGMGIGRSRTEEVVYDPQTGVKLSDNLIEYKFTGMLDYGPIDCHLVETGLGYGAYGTMGIGENIGAATSTLIGPAIYNALGIWVDDFPTTPDKILKALGKI